MFWKLLKSTTTPSDTASSTDKKSAPSLVPLNYLHKLIPVGNLSTEELSALPIKYRSFSAGQMIFNRGENADSLPYLYSGSVYLESANGNGYSVDEATFKACYPLSTHTEHLVSAISKTACEIIYLPLSALRNSAQACFDANPILNPEEAPEELSGNDFYTGFCNSFRRDELQVPSLPDIAIRLRRALQQDIGIAEAAKIIALDPGIASKLIQVVNSPLYRTLHPIARCQDAVNRLGLKTTQNLVTSISLHNLFRCKNQRLNQRIQQIWRESIQIASLSYTLANLTKSVNPDESLLAGLTFHIGALPIITYAETLHEQQYSEQDLDQTIAALEGLVGHYILKKWHFPEHLQLLPQQAAHWYHDENPSLQISDIVLLARFHAQLGHAHTNKEKLPPLNTLPAYSKLGDKTLSPDLSLEALQKAKQQIAEAIRFFRTSS